MDDKKLWEILGNVGDIEPSTNFRMKFWDRVERTKKRRSLIIRRLVPAVATLTILIIGLFIYLPKPIQYPQTPLISQKMIENFTTEELLAETINYSSLETIVVETFSSEEILVAFVPEGILKEVEMQIINEKGGEKYDEIQGNSYSNFAL